MPARSPRSTRLPSKRNGHVALTLAGMAATLALGACSFSSGGGDPPPTKVIIMPSGQAVTCQDGSSQPCPR